MDTKTNNSLDLNEVTKTVRFGLKDSTSIVKNASYQSIANRFKNNNEIKEQITKLASRINDSSDISKWKLTKADLQENIENSKDLVKKIENSLSELDNLKSDEKQNLKINFKVNQIKKSCGFGRDLFHFEEEKFARMINLLGFTEDDNVENIAKHSDGKYQNSKNKFEAYMSYIEDILGFTQEKSELVTRLLDTSAHEKERLSEINIAFKQILKNLERINNIFHKSIIFSGGQSDEGKELQNNILNNKTEFEELKKIIEESIEQIHNPKHGYEIGKATIHSRTVNKRFIPNDNIEDIENLLGKDSLRGAEFYNPLARFSTQILAAIKTTGKDKDRRLDIEQSSTIVEKAQKIIEFVKEVDGIKAEDITLWNISNALNNKKQTYSQFIRENIDFEDLGWKQKLKFGLTVLVDCDVYQPKDFIARCREIEKSVRKYLLTEVKFDKYNEYKSYTEKIKKSISQKQNAKERGKLITGALERDYTLKNKEVSQIRGGLQNYLEYLKDNETNLNLIQYFAVLAKDSQNKNIILLIDRESSQEFHQKIMSDELKLGSEKLYLYDSITEKSIKKLFNQVKSKKHPFLEYKIKLATDKNKEFDNIKFEELTLEELKELLSRDIAIDEHWKIKFSKFYDKLKNFKKKDDLLKTLTKEAFSLKEKSFDLKSLQEKFPDLIVSQLEMNSNQNKKSIHKNYFEKAFNKMVKHKDVDAKINPEFQIYYVPQKDAEEKKRKVEEKQNKMDETCLQENHRFWRDQVTMAIPIEIYSKTPNYNNSKTTRVIGIDRGEKKIATLCQLEKSEKREFVIPIEYYNENDLENLQKTYFLDLANFKVGRKDENQVIIKTSKSLDDSNLNLKKYEFISRFTKTIWINLNREKIQRILEAFDHEKSNDFEYIRMFIKNLCHTDKEKNDEKIENKIFNTHNIGTYVDRILEDTFVLSKLAELIINFNNFDFKSTKKTEEDIIRQKDLELSKIRYRDTLASNISGIVHFLFKKNKEEKIQTFCALENLHNSAYWNLVSEDMIAGANLANDDFVESTHNKLYQTSVYGKVEQAIMSKLQVFNENNRYLDYIYSIKEENSKKKHIPIKQIQFELKAHSKRPKEITLEFKEKKLQTQGPVSYGNVTFVDPAYTSKTCPKCGEHGNYKYKDNYKPKISRTTKNDYVKCNICGYSSEKQTINTFNKVESNNAHSIIKTGDENGAFFIALRALV